MPIDKELLQRIAQNDVTLKEVNLGSNDLGPEDTVALAQALKTNASLTSIGLRTNKIGATGAQALAATLKMNTSLISIDLGDNKIGATGAQVLADTLKMNTSLTSINLDSNYYMGTETLGQISYLISHNRVLAMPYQGAQEAYEKATKLIQQKSTAQEIMTAFSRAEQQAKEGLERYRPSAALLKRIQTAMASYSGEAFPIQAKLQKIQDEEKHPVAFVKDIVPALGALTIVPPKQAEAPHKKSSTPHEEKSDFGVSFTIDYTSLTLGDKLGQGGFGIVYKGTWRFNDVAIKQLLVENPTGEALDEFQNEMQVMGRLHSPNIVHFYGYCLQPKYCMVMEYMPKGSLYGVLHSKQTLEWSLRYKIITDMACGLALLHQKDILHRDLKSLNVLLDNSFKARLTDFGLAKIKTQTKTLHPEGVEPSVGTLAWKAPELFERRAKYTTKSDIYSLGITFWEVASRKHPFEEANGSEALIKDWVQKGERDDIPKDCPPKIAKLISFCWNGDPSKRPSADKVAAFLKSTEADFEKFNATPATKTKEPEYVDNLNSNANYQNNFSQ